MYEINKIYLKSISNTFYERKVFALNVNTYKTHLKSIERIKIIEKDTV